MALSTVILALGLVLVLEGLVFALAPSRIEDLLKVLTQLPRECTTPHRRARLGFWGFSGNLLQPDRGAVTHSHLWLKSHFTNCVWPKLTYLTLQLWAEGPLIKTVKEEFTYAFHRRDSAPA